MTQSNTFVTGTHRTKSGVRSPDYRDRAFFCNSPRIQGLNRNLLPLLKMLKKSTPPLRLRLARRDVLFL